MSDIIVLSTQRQNTRRSAQQRHLVSGFGDRRSRLRNSAHFAWYTCTCKCQVSRPLQLHLIGRFSLHDKQQLAFFSIYYDTAAIADDTADSISDISAADDSAAIADSISDLSRRGTSAADDTAAITEGPSGVSGGFYLIVGIT